MSQIRNLTQFDAAAVSAAYQNALRVIGAVEPTVADAIGQELADQRSSLKLIASENYASPAVLLTMGNFLSDKYAEGTIGHRFYAGCQNVDIVEQAAADHAKALFGAPHAYVQPHSGIDANLVAFWAVLAQRIETPARAAAGARQVNELSEDDWAKLRRAFGDQRMIGMSLDAGGHLTHGFRPNISGKMFHQTSYGTDPQTGLLDYDEVRRLAHEFKPLILMAGYSAYPRRINFATMRSIADEVDATLVVDMAHFAGLVAGKVFTGNFDPVPFAHVTTTTTHKSLRGPRGGASNAVALAEGFLRRGAHLVTGGTDNHIVLLDVSAYGLTGRQAESALLDSGIVTNRNSIPRDPNGAWYTSGIRLGTPALTTRGFGADDFDRVAELIVGVLSATTPGSTADGSASKAKYDLPSDIAEKTHASAAEMLDTHPLYPGLNLAAV